MVEPVVKTTRGRKIEEVLDFSYLDVTASSFQLCRQWSSDVDTIVLVSLYPESAVSLKVTPTHLAMWPTSSSEDLSSNSPPPTIGVATTVLIASKRFFGVARSFVMPQSVGLRQRSRAPRQRQDHSAATKSVPAV